MRGKAQQSNNSLSPCKRCRVGTTEPRLVCREPRSPRAHHFPSAWHLSRRKPTALPQLSSSSIAITSITSAERPLPQTPPGLASSHVRSDTSGSFPSAPPHTPRRKHGAGAGRPRGKRAPRSKSCSASAFWAAPRAEGAQGMERGHGTGSGTPQGQVLMLLLLRQKINLSGITRTDFQQDNSSY